MQNNLYRVELLYCYGLLTPHTYASIFFLVQGQQQEPVILNPLRQAQLYALATDPDTFLTEPHPDDAEEFTVWNPELDKRQGEISELMASNADIRKNYSTLVPGKVIKALHFSLQNSDQVV